MLNYNILQTIHDKCDLPTQENMKSLNNNLKTNPIYIYIAKYNYEYSNGPDPPDFWSYHFYNNINKINKNNHELFHIINNGGFNGKYEFKSYNEFKSENNYEDKYSFNYLSNDMMFDIELNKIYLCIDCEEYKNFEKITYNGIMNFKNDNKCIYKNQYFNKLYMVYIYLEPNINAIYHEYKLLDAKELLNSIIETDDDNLIQNFKDSDEYYLFTENTRFLKFYTNHKNNIEYIINTEFKREIENEDLEYSYIELQNNILIGEKYNFDYLTRLKKIIPINKK